jgi:hypothetical protein
VVKYHATMNAVKHVYGVARTGRHLQDKRSSRPRFENDAAIMSAARLRPLDDCLRITFTELIAGIERLRAV